MAATGEDYYRLLGLPRSCSTGEVKRAYRRLARRYHPDLNPGDGRAEAHFKRVCEAYEVLSDPERREEYDRLGTVSGTGRAGARRSGPSGAGADGRGFRDVLNELFRGAQARREAEARDLHSVVEVSFEDAVRGLTTRITVQRELSCPSCAGGERAGARKVRCPNCSGSGYVKRGGLFRSEMRPCSTCRGTGLGPARACGECAGRGLRAREETIAVRIPAGVDNGSRVRVPGHGNSPSGGGAPGDLYVITRVRPHPHFRREGDNLYLRVPVTVAEAALGAKIQVPTLDGPALIKVPQGTQAGQQFRLRGKGVPSLRSGERGDQFVEVQVVVPRLQDERSREIMRELAQLNPDDPRRGLFA